MNEKKMKIEEFYEGKNKEDEEFWNTCLVVTFPLLILS